MEELNRSDRAEDKKLRVGAQNRKGQQERQERVDADDWGSLR